MTFCQQVGTLNQELYKDLYLDSSLTWKPNYLMKKTSPVRNTTHARDVFKKLNILAYSSTAGPLGEPDTQCRGGQPAFKGLRIFYYPNKIREEVNYDVTAITERDGSGY